MEDVTSGLFIPHLVPQASRISLLVLLGKGSTYFDSLLQINEIGVLDSSLPSTVG